MGQLAARTIDEQETTIVFDRQHEKMKIYTSDVTMMTKLDKIYKRTKEYTDNGKVFAVEYEPNKNLLTFRSRQVKRKLTSEQKEKARERLKKARNSKA